MRELENAIERAVVLGTTGEIRSEDLPAPVLQSPHAEATDAGFQGAVKENKKQLVLQALEKADGHYVDAAKILGLHPNSLLRLIRTLGLRSVGGLPGPVRWDGKSRETPRNLHHRGHRGSQGET